MSMKRAWVSGLSLVVGIVAIASLSANLSEEKVNVCRIEKRKIFPNEGVVAHLCIDRSLNPFDYQWVQVVLHDPFEAGGALTYIDPPDGGYHYGKADHLPYYYDELSHAGVYPINSAITVHENEYTIELNDFPYDVRMEEGQEVTFLSIPVRKLNNSGEWTPLKGSFTWRLINKYEIEILEKNVSTHDIPPHVIKLLKENGMR